MCSASTEGKIVNAPCPDDGQSVFVAEPYRPSDTLRCVVVDSTRRGKSMPDALSKTIPIWSAVLNRLLFPARSDCHDFQKPEDVVSNSEGAQIEARLDLWVEQLRGLELDIDALRRKVSNHPLRIVWQRPGDAIPDSTRSSKDHSVLVLCTASNHSSHETSATSSYVQGAADDPESWSLGLAATAFWQHAAALLAASEDELPALIESLNDPSASDGAPLAPVLIRPTRNIWIANNAAAHTNCANYDVVITCGIGLTEDVNVRKKCQWISLACGPGKMGSRQLRTELAKLEHLFPSIEAETRVLVTCATGTDFAVGVALALLCRCFGNDGKLTHHGNDNIIVNKMSIKQRLSWIMVEMPDASPSRATLQSVNAFLMS